ARRPGGGGAWRSSAVARLSSPLRPGACSIASRGTPPGRSSVTPPSTQARIVDSTPTVVGPPSSTRSMRSPRSASTCSAVVGDTWPDWLAEGATTGLPNAAISACAVRCAGTRTATVSSPAVARSATGQAGGFGSTSVSGPRPNAAASASAAGSKTASARPAAPPAARGAVGEGGAQRIERRPALGGVEPCDRRRVGGVGAEPVDRLGGESDEAAVRECARGRRDRGGFVGRPARRHARSGGFRRRLDREPVEAGLVLGVLQPREQPLHCGRRAGAGGGGRERRPPRRGGGGLPAALARW